MSKEPKQVKAKRDGVIKPQNYNFHRENLMISKHYVLTEVDRRTWLRVSSGNYWSISSDTQQVIKMNKPF